MMDLIHEVTPPLAIDSDGIPFVLPPEAIGWRVRKFNGGPGRPPLVWVAHGPLVVGLETTVPQLRAAVNNVCGSYRLYAIDRGGHELGPIAAIELVPDPSAGDDGAPASADRDEPPGVAFDVELAKMCAQVPMRFFDVFNQMLESRNAHDQVLSGLLTTLVTSTSNIQQSTAGLLNAANTTVKVANGVEALERGDAPQLDIDHLADKVQTLEKLRDLFGQGGKPEVPWYVHLLNGPGGMALMGLANKLSQSAAPSSAKGDKDDE